ncbi:Imm1 family immunity protein [Streptomyces sp. NPDC057137]|uniref:Imm1 family immunity protein n=1 Tax=Streptomyces sp. NPDC057137 TaxID=3346030 RepID=UPI0036404B30
MTVTEAESWAFADGSDGPVTPDAAVDQLRSRIASGVLESWLAASDGRLLAVISNTERAMVMLLDGEGDPGGHATDPGADAESDGFVLANGQSDTYPDEDTVPLGEALRIVRHILATGGPPADVAWTVDR